MHGLSTIESQVRIEKNFGNQRHSTLLAELGQKRTEAYLMKLQEYDVDR